jgi:hypothetical protein
MPDSLLIVLIIVLLFAGVDEWYQDEIEEARENEQEKKSLGESDLNKYNT